MDQEKETLFNFSKPEIKEMEKHKKCLKAALFSKHKRPSAFKLIGYITGDLFKAMPKLQKIALFSFLTIAFFVFAAGVFGPSASSIAFAEAQKTIGRSFERFAVLSEEKRTSLEERFQERSLFKKDILKEFTPMKEFSFEEIEAKRKERIVSLAETLIEARNAPDLQIVSLEEMPKPGFFAQAGRSFGFKMTRAFDGDCPDLLSDGVCKHFEERLELREEIKPVSFLIYTNSENQKVTLGLNANDEPVIKFVQPERLPKETMQQNETRQQNKNFFQRLDRDLR